MLTLLVFIFGLLFGSFINAVVWRVKTGKPIVNDRSECEYCHHKLAVKDLVPVFSWLWLKGKCRYCGKPIAKQNLIVELLTAGLFGWSYLVWDFTDLASKVDFGFWLAILIGLIVLAIYDLKWMELPDKVMYLIMGLASTRLVTLFLITHSSQPAFSSLLAAVTAGLFFYALHIIGRGRWMGGGDVKLAIVMGLVLGSSKTLVAMFIGFNTAAVLALGFIATRKLTRKSLMPFGPFLIGGTYLAWLYGDQWFNAYLNHFLK